MWNFPLINNNHNMSGNTSAPRFEIIFLVFSEGGGSSHAGPRLWWDASRLFCGDQNGCYQSWLWQDGCHSPNFIRGICNNALKLAFQYQILWIFLRPFFTCRISNDQSNGNCMWSIQSCHYSFYDNIVGITVQWDEKHAPTPLWQSLTSFVWHKTGQTLGFNLTDLSNCKRRIMV